MLFNDYSIPFDPGLDGLPVATMDLGVPLRNNVIQVGDFTTREFGRIVVATDKFYETSVLREDGSPLQVEVIVKNTPTVHGAGSTYQRCAVFENPVDSLRFIPDSGPDTRTVWRVRAGTTRIEIADMALFEIFTLTLASYAIKKAYPGRVVHQ